MQPGPASTEAAVLELLLAGVAQPQIAAQLALSVSTVSHHAQRLARRAHVGSTAQLVARVWSERLAERDATIVRQAARIAELEETLALLGRRRDDRRRAP